MCKRVMIVLFAMSVVTMWWTEADAACLKWRYFFGKQICTKWFTNGVVSQTDFHGDCGPNGDDCKVNANASAEANNSIAYCKDNRTGKVRTEKSPVAQIFSGNAGKCDRDDDISDRDDDRDDDRNECTATIVLNRLTACQNCGTNETCVDLTPLKMTTSVNACFGISLKECIQQTPPACSEKSPICTIIESCTIDPQLIAAPRAMNKMKKYRCEPVVK